MLHAGDAGALERVKTTFIEDNAGRAFEFMVEDLSKERTSRGLKSVEDAWKGTWRMSPLRLCVLFTRGSCTSCMASLT